MLFGDNDRARASEHAIFLRRTVSVPTHEVAHALPLAARRLKGKLDVRLPGAQVLPLAVVIAPSREAQHRLLELRLRSQDDLLVEFFEGEVRLNDAGTSTDVELVGRFNVPSGLRADGCDNATLRDVAEENLVRIFDALVLEIEQALAERQGDDPPELMHFTEGKGSGR